MIEFQQTPYEEYRLDGRPITVKREDLAAPAPMPPLAKMRGLYIYLHKRAAEYQRQGVGVLDTRVSKSGLGVAVICEDLGIPCRYYFPARKDEDWLIPHRREARQHGAQLVPVQAGRMGVVLGQVRILEPGTLLPLGFPIYETVEAVAAVVQADGGQRFRGKTMIVPAGTGTILAGIISGLSTLNPEDKPAQVYAITASMDPAKVKRHALEHLSRWAEAHTASVTHEIGELLKRTRIIQQGTDYYAEGDSQVDWPTHPHYERKALDWLRQNWARTSGPALFWNIGS